jgi:formylglycine-generating enzyme required for sulfatase activity
MADLMHRPISLITPVIWLIVLVLSGFPLRAQLREAAFNGYCHSFRFLVGTASSGGFNFEMVFTSYDGGASTVLYDTDASGYAIFSDELSPNFSEPGVYRTDYALYVNKKYNAAGTISVTLPTADSDQNGISDFLQKNKQGNASVSGKLLRQLPSPLPEIPFSGQIIRSAGSSQGTYSFTGRDPEVGDVTYRGNLYLVNLLGKLKYNTTNRTVSIETDIEREGGVVIRFSSSLEYSIVDGNTISFPAGKFTSPNQPDSFTKAFVLKRTGNRYLGRLEFVDAFRGTSWPDYTAWQLEIVDTNDSDRDGVPDLSDPPIVQSPPTISVQPVSQTRTVGEAVALTVQASGSGVLSYSWRKNGVPVLNFGVVSGANGPTLSFASLQTSHAGAYSVVVSNLVGSVTSSVAQLTVNSAGVPPTIVVQPVSAAVRVGQQVTLSVQVAGTPTPSFQWQRNGANLPGATSAEWVIRSATLNDAGEYRVVVANSSGTVTSAPAFVAVLAPEYLPAITQQPQGTNLVMGQRLELRVIATGNPEPAYRWRKDGVYLDGGTGPFWTKPSVTMADAGVYQVIVSNSVGAVFSAQASVVVVPGTVVPRIVGFREIGGGDLDFDLDATAGREWVLEDSRILGNWSEVSRFLANQQRFSLRVPYQSSNSRFFRLRQADVGGKVPVIIQQPQDLTVSPGSNAVFTVVAEGTGPLVYQWFFGGGGDPISQKSTLILTNVQSQNAGYYNVRVTNFVGFVWSSLAKLTVDLGKPIGTEGFVWILPGTFVMGSPSSEEGRYDDEVQHRVTLTQGFWLSDHEVTQAEYQEVMRTNPSYFKGDPNRPVETVTWNDAVLYCDLLTARERAAGRITAQQAYRLPTEAEWEYAARAGTTGARHGELDTIAWWSGNSGSGTHPVKKKAPNAWGLHDMLGNVREWCSDWYGDYPTGSVTDPTGPNWGSGRVFRGGSWYFGAGSARSADRFRDDPSLRSFSLGFRPALSSVR